jgi:uncharacterized membrane protein YtjA (UPF0391 family)
MLRYAVLFLVIALVAALFGFGGVASGAESMAKILAVVFAALALLGFVVGQLRR